jgi:hypothetical protein
MKYLSLAVVPFAVGILTPLFFGLMRKANLKREAEMNKRDFVMSYSSAWVWTLIIGSIAATADLILLNIFGEVKLRTCIRR